MKAEEWREPGDMSLYRNAAWFLKGLREYTKSGYEAAALQFAPKDLDIDVSGRCFLITGGNSGIGKATALEIAKLGTYILTTALVPLLEQCEDARVFTVSSGGMLVQKLNLDDLQFEKGQFDGTMAYARNKRQQVIMTEQWAKIHTDIHFSSMHSGWADTEAVRSSMPDFYAKMKNKLRTAAQGADTLVWLAISSMTAQQPSGLYFQDQKPVSTHLFLAQTRAAPAEEEKLMKTLEELAASLKPGTTR